MSVHILGIRHHGPGSSRHLVQALNELKPDIVLVEGPPEGDAMMQWIHHEEMKPPVALLAYATENPQQAVFYPFASYSPEWNAIQYALQHKIPARFIDMPLTHKLAYPKNEKDQEIVVQSIDIDQHEELVKTIKRNPIAYLAEIAGFDDAEEWWEHHFELSQQNENIFEAIAHGMSALREQFNKNEDIEEQIREAFMRKAIRLAEREMYHTIAVICGAWHVPALQTMPSQKEDDLLLKNLPKTKIETTWIPWTNDRLAFESGYGAGVDSPGWYTHQWNHVDDDGIRWLSHTARIFRNNKVDISSAHIIEAVRLSHSLAGIRYLSRPGLKEFNEATQTVMCMGDDILMELIRKELIVGIIIGEVPEGTPQVPLHRDFETQIKSLRLKLTAMDKTLLLDLREENDLKKSIILHRLRTLDIHWGQMQRTSGKGTFKEEWTICWTPELNLSLIEKAPWGNSVEMACTNYVFSKAEKCNHLAEISELLEKAIPAELNEGVMALLKRMDALAASSNDTIELMNAMIPLAHISRYGNVRKNDLLMIQTILDVLFYRMIIGLPLSSIAIDDDQAGILTEKIKDIQNIMLLLENEEMKSVWFETMHHLTQNEQAAAMIKGYSNKLLFDNHHVDAEEIAIAFSKALSVNQAPVYSANWLEGFLKDAAGLLILDNQIWNIIYEWVAALDDTIFQEIIPLLRRSFSDYNVVERQKIAEKVKHGKTEIKYGASEISINKIRAERVIPMIKTLLQINE